MHTVVVARHGKGCSDAHTVGAIGGGGGRTVGIPSWMLRSLLVGNYLSELRRDFLASVGITYAVFRIAKSRLRAFSEFY